MRQIPNFPIFFSRLTQAAKAQARLCIGISSTEPSLLENEITMHCEIFQIKHWNINERVIRTYILKKVVTGNPLSAHLRDMFHVYLNRFEFHFMRLHMIKTNKCCFFMHNRRVPGNAKQTRWQFIA